MDINTNNNNNNKKLIVDLDTNPIDMNRDDHGFGKVNKPPSNGGICGCLATMFGIESENKAISNAKYSLQQLIRLHKNKFDSLEFELTKATIKFNTAKLNKQKETAKEAFKKLKYLEPRLK